MKRRIHGEALLARDALWSAKRAEGMTADAIASEAGVSKRLVNRRLAVARGAAAEAPEDPPGKPVSWLFLVPLFPIGPFTPLSECPHNGPIREGSLLCCMVCSASGMDGHPELRRDPATDPRPEPKRGPAPETSPATSAAKPETRRERRRRLFDASRESAPC